MRATYQLNTEKLEYNYRVLKVGCQLHRGGGGRGMGAWRHGCAGSSSSVSVHVEKASHCPTHNPFGTPSSTTAFSSSPTPNPQPHHARPTYHPQEREAENKATIESQKKKLSRQRDILTAYKQRYADSDRGHRDDNMKLTLEYKRVTEQFKDLQVRGRYSTVGGEGEGVARPPPPSTHRHTLDNHRQHAA